MTGSIEDGAPKAGNPWVRLGLLAAALAAAAASAVALIVFLLPQPSEPPTLTVALDELPVDEPYWYRPFNMGGDRSGRPYGVWLVRNAEDEVLALLARDTHAGSAGPCVIGVEQLEGYRLPGVTDAPAGAATPAATVTPAPPDARGSGDDERYSGAAFRGLCTGSLFLLDGTRVFGPAPRGMDRLPVEVEGGAVSIDFSRIELGPCSPGVQFRSGNCPYSTAEKNKYERASWPGAAR